MPRAKSKHGIDNYKWSTHNNNPYLRTLFWPKVKKGITQAAKDLKIKISDRDIKWLDEFNGQYCKFVPKDCRTYTDHISNKQNRLIPEQLVISEMRKMGCIVGNSPRYSLSNKPGNTDFNYETQLRTLWNFLAMVGSKIAYSSMLILLIEKTIPPPPAVDSSILAACINHKWSKFDTPLTVNGNPIHDLNNNPMRCKESLSSPEAFNNFWAALSNLHMLRGNEGNYLNQCSECNKNYTKHSRKRYKKCNVSCILHPYPTGLVTRNVLLSKLRKDISSSTKAKSHVKIQRDALFPQDILKIHENIEKNNFILEDLRNYVMILLSLDAGLRYDGCQNKTVSNFNNHAKLWKIKDDRIIHLAHSVIEKKDSKAYTYKLHFKEIPKLCALRHLLVYVHCAKLGNNDSQFFPTNIQSSDGNDKSFDAEEMYTPLNYKDLYDWLKKNTGIM